jgi:hypothetical protein
VRIHKLTLVRKIYRPNFAANPINWMLITEFNLQNTQNVREAFAWKDGCFASRTRLLDQIGNLFFRWRAPNRFDPFLARRT